MSGGLSDAVSRSTIATQCRMATPGRRPIFREVAGRRGFGVMGVSSCRTTRGEPDTTADGRRRPFY